MADSVDRVFAQALRTVRRLPRPGSTRPPPQARLRLYGLYKQSIEGDVEGILTRPTFPSPSVPNPEQDPEATSRWGEIKDEMEKWDAWRACAGLSRTEAKRRYIEVLIQTMKVYAAGTAEARELVSELEFIWSQIRSQRSGSDESMRDSGRGGAGAGDGGGEEGRLRVLSPVSRGGSGEIVEGEDASIPEREHLEARRYDDQAAEEQEEGKEENEEDFRDAPDGSEAKALQSLLDRRRKLPTAHANSSSSSSEKKWRHQLETALTKITTELAALREQLDELNLYHSSFSSSSHHHRSSFAFLGRRSLGTSGSGSGSRWRTGLLAWTRWLFSVALRHAALDALLLAVLLLWGVWTGDRRVERWVGRRWSQVRTWTERVRTRWELGAGCWVYPARFLS